MSVITAERGEARNSVVLSMEAKEICERSDMEETGMHNTKISDSGYSNSCSNNSQSQRSGISKSCHSGGSSGSSGYCGHPSTLGSSNDSFQHPSATKQRKEYKKKKLKAMAGDLLNDTGGVSAPAVASSLESLQDVATSSHAIIENSFLPSNSSQNTEKENIQLNPLSHPSLSISCIKKIKGKDMMTVTGEEEGESAPSPDGNEKDDSKVAMDHIRRISSFRKEFIAVVSMQNGTVLFTSGNLKEVLGYPKDMWLERSLIDFVHPKDRKTFLSQIASGIATPLVLPPNNGNQNSLSLLIGKRNPFYCWMRQYRGLKSTGFGLTNRKASYLPCQLSLAFREISTADKTPFRKEIDDAEDEEVLADGNVLRMILLVVCVRPVRSAYKSSDETCASSTFTTRHSPSMIFTHADSEVVPYFGYVPQDMVGRSAFDFYHPEDLPYLKEVYEIVFKDKGQPFRSKPYRFRTQNGGFAEIETEWSSFVNPWSKKVEFVTGQHRVIKGPPNPDVVTPVADLEPVQVSEEVMKESANAQEEIIKLLNEAAETADTSKCQMTKYCNELLKYITNFVDDANPPSNQSDGKPVSLSISDRDSVMLGEISPHHEYYDSKSSSETPPSYNYLSYNENIHRFFESKPKTIGSDESTGGSKRRFCGERGNLPSGGDEEGKISPAVEFSCGGSQNRSLLPNALNRNSGLNQESGGSSDMSSGSGSGNNNDMFDNDFDNPYLNEELLSIHNEIVRKHLAQIQRERMKSDKEHQIKDGRQKKTYDKVLDEQNGHGVKRSGSHSWEGEPYKSIKQTHTTDADGQNTGNTPSVPKLNNLEPTSTSYQKPVTTSSDVNLWPPFSVTITPLQSSQPCGTHLSYSAAPITNSMMPVYYLPPDVLPSARIGNCAAETIPPISPYIQPPQPPYIPGQFQYMTSMMYHPVAAMPMFGVPPVMYSPLTMLPAPLMPTQPMKPQGQQQQQQPADCNNILQSQQVLSETSKRERKSMVTSSPQSLSQECRDCSDLDKSKPEVGSINMNDHLEHNIHNDSSSYYSSFYSFMKTDKSDESMKSLTENEGSVDMQADNKNLWRKELDNCGNVPEQMRRRIRKDPPWLENVSLSPDLVFRYQVSEKELSQVLEADLKILSDTNQPLMVNDQLCQLYLDIESYHQQDCALETSIGVTSSSGTSSGEGDDSPLVAKSKKKYRSMDYHDRMVRLFEENAPMPPPLSHPNKVPTLLTVPST